MKGIIWFRHDLRLADNPALISLSKQCDNALMLYVIDPSWFKPANFQSKHLGEFREQFLYQSLHALDKKLKKHKQRLVVKFGDPLKIIPELCKQHQIDIVTATDHPGTYEQNQIHQLKTNLDCELLVCQSFTLFLANQLQFENQTFPETYSKFKRIIEKKHILPCIPISPPDELPKRIYEHDDFWGSQELTYDLGPYQGGENAGIAQLQKYFWKIDGLNEYKETRNHFDDWDGSSRLSAWLANGTISPRMVAAELDKYEYRKEANASTKAMYSELLWREYFQWMLYYKGNKLFDVSGIKNKPVTPQFDPERFKAWQEGNTDYPIVNACMRQLNQTGYMSNRGRQLAASCLINELDIDWRFGAAYFEQQLIDFDVAANYGNWQYLAGVGADPRGKRHFNLDKQTKQYDPEGKFVKHWENKTAKSLIKF